MPPVCVDVVKTIDCPLAPRAAAEMVSPGIEKFARVDTFAGLTGNEKVRVA